MDGETVQLIQGTKQIRGEVVSSTATTITVQTVNGLFTVNRDGSSRRGGWRLHNPSPEEIAEAKRLRAIAEEARRGAQRVERTAAALRVLATLNTSSAVTWDAATEQRFDAALAEIRSTLEPHPTERTS